MVVTLTPNLRATSRFVMLGSASRAWAARTFSGSWKGDGRPQLLPAAQSILTELVHQRPRRWPDDVERLHELLQAFGSAALRAAFERVAGQSGLGVERVAHELEALAPPFDTRPQEDPS